MTSVPVETAAVALGVSRRSIYNYIRRGHLETVRFGVTKRVAVGSLLVFAAVREPRMNKELVHRAARVAFLRAKPWPQLEAAQDGEEATLKHLVLEMHAADLFESSAPFAVTQWVVRVLVMELASRRSDVRGNH